MHHFQFRATFDYRHVHPDIHLQTPRMQRHKMHQLFKWKHDLGDKPTPIKSADRAAKKYDPKRIKFGFIMAGRDGEREAWPFERDRILGSPCCRLSCRASFLIPPGILTKNPSTHLRLLFSLQSGVNLTTYSLIIKSLSDPRQNVPDPFLMHSLRNYRQIYVSQDLVGCIAGFWRKQKQ